MRSKSELEDALKLLLPALEKEATRAELEVCRYYQPGNHLDSQGQTVAATTVQETAYAVGYARGVGAAKIVLQRFVYDLKT